MSSTKECKENYQCVQCGLCTLTQEEMLDHWKASDHSAYRKVSIDSLVQGINHRLEGLKTFKRALNETM